LLIRYEAGLGSNIRPAAHSDLKPIPDLTSAAGCLISQIVMDAVLCPAIGQEGVATRFDARPVWQAGRASGATSIAMRVAVPRRSRLPVFPRIALASERSVDSNIGLIALPAFRA
jgi:hypothetical protein